MATETRYIAFEPSVYADGVVFRVSIAGGGGSSTLVQDLETGVQRALNTIGNEIAAVAYRSMRDKRVSSVTLTVEIDPTDV